MLGNLLNPQGMLGGAAASKGMDNPFWRRKEPFGGNGFGLYDMGAGLQSMGNVMQGGTGAVDMQPEAGYQGGNPDIAAAENPQYTLYSEENTRGGQMPVELPAEAGGISQMVRENMTPGGAELLPHRGGPELLELQHGSRPQAGDLSQGAQQQVDAGNRLWWSDGNLGPENIGGNPAANVPDTPAKQAVTQSLPGSNWLKDWTAARKSGAGPVGEVDKLAGYPDAKNWNWKKSVKKGWAPFTFKQLKKFEKRGELPSNVVWHKGQPGLAAGNRAMGDMWRSGNYFNMSNLSQGSDFVNGTPRQDFIRQMNQRYGAGPYS